jgi:hypothetical protein
MLESDQYRGGLVTAPRFVGWVRRGSIWRAAITGDTLLEVRRRLQVEYGGAITAIMAAGLHPEGTAGTPAR